MKHAPAGSDPRRSLLAFARRKALPAAVYFIGAWYASTYLLHLSGGALWLPIEWREVVKVLGVLLGMCVFGFTRARRGAADARAADGEHSAADHEAAHARRYKSAIMLTLAALVLLCAYVGLRARCVIEWTPPAQWRERYASTTVPSFVDVERGTVYLPARLPAELKGRIAAAERAPDNNGQLDGITYLLTYAPDELFDWLTVNGRGALAWTTLLFLLIHLGILVLVSIALGLTFAPASALGKMVAP